MGRYDVLLGKENSSNTVAEPAPTRTVRNASAPQPALHSSLDTIPRIVPATKGEEPSTPVPPVREVLPVRDVRPVLPVPPAQGAKRVMKQRHPSDIYRDQYESLQELAIKDRMNGGIGSMSAMVREALDLFIASKQRKG
jgi:hypothetical protein